MEGKGNEMWNKDREAICAVHNNSGPNCLTKSNYIPQLVFEGLPGSKRACSQLPTGMRSLLRITFKNNKGKIRKQNNK